MSVWDVVKNNIIDIKLNWGEIYVVDHVKSLKFWNQFLKLLEETFWIVIKTLLVCYWKLVLWYQITHKSTLNSFNDKKTFPRKNGKKARFKSRLHYRKFFSLFYDFSVTLFCWVKYRKRQIQRLRAQTEQFLLKIKRFFFYLIFYFF